MPDFFSLNRKWLSIAPAQLRTVFCPFLSEKCNNCTFRLLFFPGNCFKSKGKNLFSADAVVSRRFLFPSSMLRIDDIWHDLCYYLQVELFFSGRGVEAQDSSDKNIHSGNYMK